jgi:hypothetical protein
LSEAKEKDIEELKKGGKPPMNWKNSERKTGRSPLTQHKPPGFGPALKLLSVHMLHKDCSFKSCDYSSLSWSNRGSGVHDKGWIKDFYWVHKACNTVKEFSFSTFRIHHFSVRVATMHVEW